MSPGPKPFTFQKVQACRYFLLSQKFDLNDCNFYKVLNNLIHVSLPHLSLSFFKSGQISSKMLPPRQSVYCVINFTQVKSEFTQLVETVIESIIINR